MQTKTQREQNSEAVNQNMAAQKILKSKCNLPLQHLHGETTENSHLNYYTIIKYIANLQVSFAGSSVSCKENKKNILTNTQNWK